MKFSIIYADPPWSYNDSASAGKRGAIHKYPTMTIPELVDLRPKIDLIAADDCALFLWATAPMIREGLHLMFKWGFDYKTIAFVWVKKNKKADSNFWGMGNWSRTNAEYILLGIRGNIRRESKAVHQIIEARIGAHSAKPTEARERITKLMGNRPSVELFARDKAPGWFSSGHGIEGPDTDIGAALYSLAAIPQGKQP